ncbi:Conserved_hypothetical protein [Hexamita inflata]|uniref:Uncharacterized protein n=1 Tax=Hexamita inflata TaxID=28002 RepID=A0AA86UDI4_9EUKA|nr:Conserved hypothetical protein [Hexamita inflata]
MSDTICDSVLSDGYDLNQIILAGSNVSSQSRSEKQLQILFKQQIKLNMSPVDFPKLSNQKSFAQMLLQLQEQTKSNQHMFPEEFQNQFLIRSQVSTKPKILRASLKFLFFQEQEVIDCAQIQLTKNGIQSQNRKQQIMPQFQNFDVNNKNELELLKQQFISVKLPGTSRILQFFDPSFTKNVIVIHDFFQSPLDTINLMKALYQDQINVATICLWDLAEIAYSYISITDFVQDYLIFLVHILYNTGSYQIMCQGTAFTFAQHLNSYDKRCQRVICSNPIFNQFCLYNEQKQKQSYYKQQKLVDNADISIRSEEEFDSQTVSQVKSSYSCAKSSLKSTTREKYNQEHISPLTNFEDSEISESQVTPKKYSTKMYKLNSMINVNKTQNTGFSIIHNIKQQKAQIDKLLQNQLITMLHSLYDNNTIGLLMNQINSNLKCLIPTSFDDFAKTFKKNLMHSRKVNTFKQYLPSLLVCSQIRCIQPNDDYYDQQFFKVLAQLQHLLIQEVPIYREQNIVILLGDHSPLITSKQLRLANELSRRNSKVILRTLFGVGQEMFSTVTTLLLELIKQY